MSSVLRQWVDEMRAGRISLGDLVARINERGRIDDAAHLRELDDLDALQQEGALESRLHRAVRSKVTDVQGGPAAPPAASAPAFDATIAVPAAVLARRPEPAAPAATPQSFDATIAVPSPPQGIKPEPAPSTPAFDATIAAPAASLARPPEPAQPAPAFDATIAASAASLARPPEPAASATPASFDATIAVPSAGLRTPVTPPEPPPSFDATIAVRAAARSEDLTRVRPPVQSPPSGRTSQRGAPPARPAPVSTDSGPSSDSARSWQNLSMIIAPSQKVGPGSKLKDRFLLEREIGRGGMGVVYLALDERKVEARDRNPRVAIKVLNDEFRRHPDSLIALQRESRKAQHLAHDNIVRVYDFDKDGTVVFMTMEYVDGSDLKALIKTIKGQGMPLEEAFPLIEGMALALGRAHREGIVHSDFKPGNVMLTSTRVPKVFDFGIARAGKRAGEQVGEQTVFDAGSLGALTPSYASLEMLKGIDPEGADDVYALSCVAYELLAGRHPFDMISADLAQQKGMEPARIPGLSNLQWKTLAKGLAFERAERLARPEELLAGLRTRTLQERALPFALTAVGALVVAGLVVWLVIGLVKQRKVEGVDTCIASGECADASQLADRLQALDGPDRARIREARLDAIKGVFYRSLAKAWAPDQNRYAFADAQKVVTLASGLYGPDSAWVQEFRDGLEASRNRELSRLNDEFNRQIMLGVFQDAKDEGNALRSVLDAVRTIDPAQPLLRDGRILEAFDHGIRAGLADGTLAPQAQLDLADRRLEIARRYVPDPAALGGLAAELKTRAQEVAAAAAEDQHKAEAAAQREQRVAALDALLAAPAASAEWRTRVHDAWLAARESSAAGDADLARRGETLAGTLLDQSAQAQTGGDLDAALEPVRFGQELLPDDARLERQFKTLDAARDHQIAQAATEAERDRLSLARFDDLLARPMPAASWFSQAKTSYQALAARGAPVAQELGTRRDRLAEVTQKMVDDLVAGGDFGKADDVARLGGGLGVDDARLSGLAGRVTEGRSKAQADRVAQFQALAGQKAFTPDWQKSVDAALAGLKGVDDPALRAASATLAEAYAQRTDQLAGEQNYVGARQALEAGRHLFPQSEPLKGAATRLDAAENANRAERDRQQAQFKVQELERTIPLKAAASEIGDAVAALQQLRKLDPDNAYARDEAPKAIAAGALAQAERLAAKKDWEGAMKAADRGLAVLPTPELQAARAGYEKSDCAADLDQEAKSRGVLPASRRVQCLALVKKDPQLYAKYKSLEVPPPGTPVTAGPVVATAPPTGKATVRVTATGPDPCRGAHGGCQDPLGQGGKIGNGPTLVSISGLGSVAIGRYEITARDYARYCKDTNACPPPTIADAMPMSGIGVAQVLAYIQWLSDVSGRRYRLPTEPEWVYAATVDGKDVLGEGNCRVMQGGRILRGGAPRSATSGTANDFGLLNAIGNVWEMTQAPGGGAIVLRGGSYDDEQRNCNSEARQAFGGPEATVGFRVAREIDQ